MATKAATTDETNFLEPKPLAWKNKPVVEPTADDNVRRGRRMLKAQGLDDRLLLNPHPRGYILHINDKDGNEVVFHGPLPYEDLQGKIADVVAQQLDPATEDEDLEDEE